jgi:hypothetical protein
LYGSELEHKLLVQGMDTTVRVQGKNNTSIRIQYVLMSRPLVYALTHPDAQAEADRDQGHVWKSLTEDRPDFLAALRSQGFKEVIFTDGYEHTWSVPTGGPEGDIHHGLLGTSLIWMPPPGRASANRRTPSTCAGG